MKLRFLLSVFCVTMALSIVANAQNTGSPQQKITVTGKVVVADGEPLAGAAVIESETTNGTVTNSDGKFSISVQRGALLTVSFLGYVTEQVNAQSGTELVITLTEELKALDEVVVVGYGQQRVATVTGSVSQVKSDKITVAPQANVTNMLAGQLPGLITKQVSGIPGADDSSLNIRGFGAPLVIVDGIETSLNKLDASQIETISILKDGAASIYGARGGRGVLLITTKRGTLSKPTLTVNSSYTWQGSTRVIKPATARERAEHKNNEWIYSGKDPADIPYTSDELSKLLNTDWYGASIRRLAPQQNHNVSLSGGNETVKYYGYFGYNSQETILKKNGGFYDRYNFQVNLNTKVTKSISLLMDIQHIREQRYYPAGADGVATNNNFWRDLIYAADPAYPLTLPDASKEAYAGIPYGSPTWATDAEKSGYLDQHNTSTQFRSEVRYDAPFLPGLYAKGTVIYRDNVQDNKTVKKQESFYTHTEETGYTLVRNSQDPQVVRMAKTGGLQITQQYSLNYENTFNDDHNLSAMLMYEWQYGKANDLSASRGGYQSMAIEEFMAGDPATAGNGSASRSEGRVSYIGRLNYNYKERYMVETIFRADASSRYAKGYRWGYFPSVSLGWNIAREAFLRDKTDIFDILKLRLSYGMSGNDDVVNHAYLSGYGFDATYTLGGNLISGLYPTGMANPTLSWETIDISNIGIDFSMWRNKLYGNVELFHRRRTGIPATRNTSLPSTFGAALQPENLNSDATSGLELKLGTSGRIGELRYDVSGNIAWSRTKWNHFEEAEYTDSDEIRLYKRSGNYNDRRIGYVFDGLFTSQGEIDAWKPTFDALNNDNSSLRPGDVRYKDLNGDGKINWKDQQEIGRGALPHWTYGFNLNLAYKNFDLSALLQGAFDYTTYIDLTAAPTELQYKNYWNDKTNNRADALLPRPSGSSTNGFYSDYYNHNTSYLRLKNFSLGYTLPQSLLNKANIGKMRVYVAGTNLFTISSLNKYGVDPEMPEGYAAGVYYPQQFTISVGCNLTF